MQVFLTLLCPLSCKLVSMVFEGTHAVDEVEGRHCIGIVLGDCQDVDIILPHVQEGCGAQQSHWGQGRDIVCLPRIDYM